MNSIYSASKTNFKLRPDLAHMRSRKNIKSILYSIRELLYGFGISFVKPSLESKRRKFFDPLYITIINVVIMSKDFSSMIVNNDTFSIIVGDYAYKWKLKNQFNLLMVLTFILPVGTHLFHFLYYRKKKFDYWLTLSSDDHPLGTVVTLDRISQFVLNMFEVITHVMFPMGFFLLCFSSLAMSCTLKELVLSGIPWSIVYAFYGLYDPGMYLFQMLYFVVLSYDCKLEFKQLNRNLESFTRTQTKNTWNFEPNLKIFIKTLDRNRRDFTKINDFWSKYLFFNWIAMSSVLSGFLLQILFGKLGITINCMFGSIFMIGVIYLSVLIYSATTLYNETNKTFKIVNQLFIRSIDSNINIKTKLKVNQNLL